MKMLPKIIVIIIILLISLVAFSPPEFTDIIMDQNLIYENIAKNHCDGIILSL